jgi:hypothetical protein
MPICDSCGEFFNQQEGSERTRTEVENLGGAARSHVELQNLCATCTKTYDGTQDTIIKVIAGFFGAAIVLLILSWICSGRFW